MSSNYPKCSIPAHEWLVLEVDDFMDASDPMGIAEGRHRPHEYFPEIPDLIDMIVTDQITADRFDAMWVKFFGHVLGEYATTSREDVLDGLRAIRSKWLGYLEETTVYE